MPPDRHLIAFAGLAEPFSSGTHLGAALLLLAGSVALVRRARGDGRRLLACLAYLFAAVTLYVASAIYHGLPAASPLRPLFWRIDHASIWIVIGTTFAAVRVLVLDPGFSAAQAALLVVSVTGATLEVSVMDRLPLWVSPLLYVAMGWFGCFPTLVSVARRLGSAFAAPMLWGGLAATAGGLMDASSRPCLLQGVFEAHELLHVATAVAGLVYFLVILRSADGRHAHAAEAPAEVEVSLWPAPRRRARHRRSAASPPRPR